MASEVVGDVGIIRTIRRIIIKQGGGVERTLEAEEEEEEAWSIQSLSVEVLYRRNEPLSTGQDSSEPELMCSAARGERGS